MIGFRKMIGTSLIGAAALSAPAFGDVIEVRYDFPTHANISLLYGFFGGDHGPLEGRILSTTLVIENYLVADPNDAADFYLTFDVPVIDAPRSQVRLLGTDLGWSGAGGFSHSFTTDDFNGQIRPGRFGAEFIGGGDFVGEAYISFTVDTSPVPAPGALALLCLGAVTGVRRRR